MWTNNLKAKTKPSCVTLKLTIYPTKNAMIINQFAPQNFCLCFVFTGIYFWDMLRHVCDIACDENMCGPIRTSKCRSTNWLNNYMDIVKG